MECADLAPGIVELTPYVPRPKTAALRETSFRTNAWTPRDVDTLQTMFHADETLNAIAAATGHRLAGVASKLFELGLRRNSKRPWSELEDAELARRYGAEPAARIAQDLGRGCSAVYVRAASLGLNQEGAPDWDPWEDEQLRAGYAAGIPLAQIASLIGRRLGGVNTRASALGLRHPSHPIDWSEPEAARALALAEDGLPYPEIRAILVKEGFPPRSKAGFGAQIRKLGYGRGWGRPWTEEEDLILRRAYEAGESLTTVAARTGRDRWGVNSRATVLKLSGSHPKPNGFRQGPDWTACEEAKLRAEYGSKPVRQLALEFGRPKGAVYCRAQQLGINAGYFREWSEEEDLALASAWLQPIGISAAAACLGRDPAVAAKRAAKIGISFSDGRRPCPPKRGVTASKAPPSSLAELLETMPADEVRLRLASLGVRFEAPAPQLRGRANPKWGQAQARAA